MALFLTKYMGAWSPLGGKLIKYSFLQIVVKYLLKTPYSRDGGSMPECPTKKCQSLLLITFLCSFIFVRQMTRPKKMFFHKQHLAPYRPNMSRAAICLFLKNVYISLTDVPTKFLLSPTKHLQIKAIFRYLNSKLWGAIAPILWPLATIKKAIIIQGYLFYISI